MTAGALALMVLGASVGCSRGGRDLSRKGTVNTVADANPGFYAVVLETGVDVGTMASDLGRERGLVVTHRSDREPVKGFLVEGTRPIAERLAADSRVAYVTERPRSDARRDGKFYRSARPQLGLYSAKVVPAAVGLPLPQARPDSNALTSNGEENKRPRRLRREAKDLSAVHGGKVKEVWPTYKVLFHATELQARRWSEDPSVEYVEELGFAHPLERLVDSPTTTKVRTVPDPTPGFYAVVIHDYDVDFSETISSLERDYSGSVTHRQEKSPVRGFLAKMDASIAESLASDPRIDAVSEIPKRPDHAGRFRRGQLPVPGRYTAKINTAAVGWRPFAGPAYMNPYWREQDAQEFRLTQQIAYDLTRDYGGVIAHIGNMYVGFVAQEWEAQRISNDPRVEFVYDDGYGVLANQVTYPAQKSRSARE